MDKATGFGHRARLGAALGVLLAAGLTGMSAMSAQAADALPAELANARQTLAQAWADAPLSFNRALFTQGASPGYGLYTPRAEATFTPGEPLHVYAEPVGYGYGSNGDIVTVNLVAGFELRNTRGQILAENDDFARLTAERRHEIREFHTSLTYRFEGLTAGDYILVTRLSDANSDKSGSFSLPFTVKAAEAQ